MTRSQLKTAAAFAGALLTRRPLYAQLVVTRRCNLSCGYCTEYDQTSPPIPLSLLRERIDALHALGTFLIGLHGGEPLLHPELGRIVEHGARRAQVSLTTNGFLLSDAVIDELNDAGLFTMQVSIDSLRPDESGYIQKSLKTLRPKLERLKQRARFNVFVNAVLCERTRDDFRELVDTVAALGLRLSVGIVHDERGAAAVQGAAYLDDYEYFHARVPSADFVGYDYNRKLLDGETPAWRCLAGARYIYVDENGRVQLCPAQPGRIDKSILRYTAADVRDAFRRDKGCESGCAMMCAFRPSVFDNQPLRTTASLVRGVLRQRLSRA